MIPPHGGTLVNRFLSAQEAAYWRGRIPSLPKIRLTPRQLSDAQLIAQGAFSPLEGFMGSADYNRVVVEMRLSNGQPWSLPVTLAVSQEEARLLQDGAPAALEDSNGGSVGILHLEECYEYDKGREAREVYRTTDPSHPGVQVLLQQGDVLLGGKVSLFQAPSLDGVFTPYLLTPAQTRANFLEREWKSVVGFQTRNPIHRAHEYLQKSALELVDGLFLHPLVGETKSDDIPADVRLRCYEVLLKDYYPAQRVVLGAFPAFMRYAGPREAVFHAIVRKNYGCTHFIVGRDHAGVGSFYGPFDAHHIFREFQPEELGITPIFFDNAFYCRLCGGMATLKTCPHPEGERVSLSGTQVRALLSRGELPPPEFTRPEVARLLLEASRSQEVATR